MIEKLCVNPWLGLHVNGIQGYNPCCLYKRTIPGSLESYVSGELNDIKSAFLSGDAPKECSLCYDEEARGITSKRQRDNKRYGHLLNRHLKSKIQDRFVEYYIRMGNHCNLRCTTCNSYESSGWVSENKKYGDPSGTVWSIGKEHEIWQKIRENSKNTGLINFLGGEPFMFLESEQIDLLDYLISSGDSNHIILQYNTNCTRLSPSISERWKKFRKVELKISMDGIGPRFEYLRYPAVWSEFEKNLDWYIEISKQHPNMELSIIYTVSIFNLGYAEEAATYCANKNVPIFWNSLEDPDYFYPANIPSAREWILSRLSSTKETTLRSHASVLENYEGRDLTDLFKKRVDLLDSRRGLKFSDVFEELSRCIK